MTDLITDAMVEEAAEAAYTQAAWDAQNFTGTNWTELDPAHRAPWLREAKAALEVVAPLIAAKALRDAADEVCTHSYKSDEVTGVPTSEQVSWLVGTSDAHRMFDRLLKDRAERFERGES